MREATPEARPPIANGSHPVIKSDRPESVTPAVGNEAAKSQSARPSTASAEPVAVEKPSASFRPTSAEPLAAPSSEPGVPCRYMFSLYHTYPEALLQYWQHQALESEPCKSAVWLLEHFRNWCSNPVSFWCVVFCAMPAEGCADHISLHDGSFHYGPELQS